MSIWATQACTIPHGMVQAWMGHNVTPLKRRYDKSD